MSKQFKPLINSITKSRNGRLFPNHAFSILIESVLNEINLFNKENKFAKEQTRRIKNLTAKHNKDEEQINTFNLCDSMLTKNKLECTLDQCKLGLEKRKRIIAIRKSWLHPFKKGWKKKE